MWSPEHPAGAPHTPRGPAPKRTALCVCRGEPMPMGKQLIGAAFGSKSTVVTAGGNCVSASHFSSLRTCSSTDSVRGVATA
eukprot:3733256-Prymnesium_polylepis.1